MATSVYYQWCWKSLINAWSTFFTFYWKDFNPNVPSRPSNSKNDMVTSWETSYNLSWFQVGNEVCCCLFWFENTGSSNVDVSWHMYFEHKIWSQWYRDWMWDESNWAEVLNNGWYMHYYYAWIDDDEIRPWYTDYRFYIEWSSSDGSHDKIEIPFSVSNLSFDISLHNAGYLRVEWNYLCYTDGTRGTQWYKHKINYDTGYNWWSGDPWYLWINTTTWDKYLYYTDSSGTVRRTHYSSAWYWWSWSPSWAVKWNIRVSNGNYQEGYWYLCFVDNSWEVRRIWNWTP